MALTRKRPDVIPFTLTVTGQGERISFDLTYHNRRQSEIDELNASYDGREDAKPMIESVLFVVKEWDSEYELTQAGLEELEGDMPGILFAIFQGFYEARTVTKTKNS